jgi:hypothetical protein
MPDGIITFINIEGFLKFGNRKMFQFRKKKVNGIHRIRFVLDNHENFHTVTSGKKPHPLRWQGILSAPPALFYDSIPVIRCLTYFLMREFINVIALFKFEMPNPNKP